MFSLILKPLFIDFLIPIHLPHFLPNRQPCINARVYFIGDCHLSVLVSLLDITQYRTDVSSKNKILLQLLYASIIMNTCKSWYHSQVNRCLAKWLVSYKPLVDKINKYYYLAGKFLWLSSCLQRNFLHLLYLPVLEHCFTEFPSLSANRNVLRWQYWEKNKKKKSHSHTLNIAP